MALSMKDRRALGAGALTIALIAGGSRGLPAWRGWIAAEEERAWTADTEVARARASVEALRLGLADSLARARSAYLALAPSVLSGQVSPTMGAALLSQVSLAASRSGLQVASMEATGDSLAGRHFIRVTVRGDVTGDAAGLLEFVRMLEGGPTRVSLRELSVDQPEPGAPADQPEALRIRFVVAGVGQRREAAR